MRLFPIGYRSPRHISVFLGSPSDVAEERNATRDIVTELADHPLLKGRISIGLLTWTRKSPLEGHADPQQAVVKYVGRPSECDLTIILLSGRLGTPFGQRKSDGSLYRSGTEWEFEDARRAKKPVFVYVRRNPRDPQTDEEREQRRALSGFLADLHLARNDYDSVEEFRALFREHLLRFVRRYTEPSWAGHAVLAGVAAIAITATIYVGTPAHPRLRVDSIETKYLTSVPDKPQQVRLIMRRTVIDGRLGDECLVQVSESPSFAGPRGDVLEQTSGVVEYDGVPCEQNPWDFPFQLARRPHIDVWHGWVRIALRRGDRIFESEAVEVKATAKTEAPTAEKEATQ